MDPWYMPVVTVVAGGLVAALVSYFLHSRWQNNMLQRQKLEELFSSVKLYVSSLHSINIPFVNFLQDKITLATVRERTKESMNDARDGEHKMIALTHIYFPNMVKLVNELYEARVNCDSIAARVMKFHPGPYADFESDKERFSVLVLEIDEIEKRLLQRIIEKADKINKVSTEFRLDRSSDT